MAERIIKLGPLGEPKRMDTEIALTTSTVDIEIKPDAPCYLDLAITKPTGAVLTVILKYGSDGAEVPQIVSADATTATSVEVTGILMMHGDELRVDIDATSGTKTVSARAVRYPRC